MQAVLIQGLTWVQKNERFYEKKPLKNRSSEVAKKYVEKYSSSIMQQHNTPRKG